MLNIHITQKKITITLFSNNTFVRECTVLKPSKRGQNVRHLRRPDDSGAVGML